jgi:hypothetical protein
MLLLIASIKLLAEIALLAMLGQAALGLLAGAGRQANPVYRLFQALTRPLYRVARWCSPRFVPDRHVPLVAFGLCLNAWLLSTLAKIGLCLHLGAQQCR